MSQNSDIPLVSIIMNCFNGEIYLKESLDSIISQSHHNWELIFWDNQSIDNSAIIFKNYKDSRFKYFYSNKHTKLYEARNYAVNEAKGDYIAFLDVDDWWDSEKIKIQLNLFTNQSIGLVYSNYWLVNEKNNTTNINYKKTLSTGSITNDLLKDYRVALCTIIARTEVFKKGICFNPKYHVIGDFDFVIRTSLHYNIECSQKPLSFYRWHNHNETSKNNLRNIEELEYWYFDNTNFKDFANYKFTELHAQYLKGIYYMKLRKYYKVFIIFINMDYSLYKFKLLLLLFFPYIILKFQKLS
jgi:glycosyltransferase involved in cell wall biosynthesis